MYGYGTIFRPAGIHLQSVSPGSPDICPDDRGTLLCHDCVANLVYSSICLKSLYGCKIYHDGFCIFHVAFSDRYILFIRAGHEPGSNGIWYGMFIDWFFRAVVLHCGFVELKKGQCPFLNGTVLFNDFHSSSRLHSHKNLQSPGSLPSVPKHHPDPD